MKEGTSHIEVGRIPARTKSSATIVVLSRNFPWSPAVLSLMFKLKVFVHVNSFFLSLAKEYYSRFREQVEVEEASSLENMSSDMDSCFAVVDEGWSFSDQELSRLSRVARVKPVFKVGGSYKVSANDAKGGLEIWRLAHWSVGGVTDMESMVIRWYSLTPGNSTIDVDANFPRRDLRSLLKGGIPGRKAIKPPDVPLCAVDRVVYLQKGEVSAAGLYPIEGVDKPPAVRTIFDGDQWVTRWLTSSEALALKDIPEPLEMLVSREFENSLDVKQLSQSCRVPLKSLSAILLPILLKEVVGEEDKTQPMECEDLEEDGVYQVQVCELATEMEEQLMSCAEMEAEEAGCLMVGSLLDILKRRLREGTTEGRSKRSDYEVPSEIIWDIRTLPYCAIRYPQESNRYLLWRKAFLILRRSMLRFWKRQKMRSILLWRKTDSCVSESELNDDALIDCAGRIADATLWGWDGGSRPFFWLWPEEIRSSIRDGFPFWIEPVRVSWNDPQPRPSPKNHPMMLLKIADVRRKGYLAPGKATSLIRFFGVPKGDDDVRMVYDGTKSGLNAALWAPWFPLPTAATHLRMVESHSWMADNDAGEFFLNWMMDKRVRTLCGVDVSYFLNPNECCDDGKDATNRRIEIWTRCAMGLRPSPYVCVKGMLLAKETIMGGADDPFNVFRWDHVALNLPGMANFDSSKPWVSKRRRDGTIAANVLGFVDDFRITASTETECWEASQIVAKRMAELGLQDAARKRNPPSQSPGAWAGVVVTTDNTHVYVSVSQKKWDKTKECVRTIAEHLPSGKIPFKLLESVTGYLVYVAQAYPALKPYLAGLYGTLNSWRPNRTEDGFKVRKKRKRPKLEEPILTKSDFEFEGNWWMEGGTDDLDGIENEEPYCTSEGAAAPPALVRFVSRAKQDVEALFELTVGVLPPFRVVRGSKTVSLIYGFGDASGTGFGSAFQLEDGSVLFRRGVWGWKIKHETSSNYKELRNLVESVELLKHRDVLRGCQLMLFTDNTTAEAAFHRSGSTSLELHELVLRLRKLEMTLGSELIIVHVSGKRMIESGVDGVSRGDNNAGMMAGQPIHTLIPLHLSAFDRSQVLESWIHQWAGKNVETMTPSQWPCAHKTSGCYLWSPPPAAADAALEWLGESVHKRSSSIHIVVVPRLMTSRWRKTLGKMCDVHFVVPCGTPVWPAEMYEPLVIGISLPLRRNYVEDGKWRYKGSKRVDRVEAALPQMWECNFGSVRDTLFKLLGEARLLQAM